MAEIHVTHRLASSPLSAVAQFERRQGSARADLFADSCRLSSGQPRWPDSPQIHWSCRSNSAGIPQATDKAFEVIVVAEVNHDLSGVVLLLSDVNLRPQMASQKILQ